MDIAAIEKSIMSADEATLKVMAESIPMDIWTKLSPEARSRLAKAYGKEVPASSPYTGVLPMKKAHRKLTEKERDRMIDVIASGPLTYRPAIDDELFKLGLIEWYDRDPKTNAVDYSGKPFYANNGRILPEWYDFELQRTGSQAYGRGVKQLREVANQYENVTVMLPVEIISIIEGKTQEKQWGKINAAKVIRYVADMLEI